MQDDSFSNADKENGAGFELVFLQVTGRRIEISRSMLQLGSIRLLLSLRIVLCSPIQRLSPLMTSTTALVINRIAPSYLIPTLLSRHRQPARTLDHTLVSRSDHSGILGSWQSCALDHLRTFICLKLQKRRNCVTLRRDRLLGAQSKFCLFPSECVD